MVEESLEEKLTPLPELKPDTSGDTPGTPLYDFFLDKLPPDLPVERYEGGLSCIGFARLVLTELGGPDNARIFWVERHYNAVDYEAHAYVVPNDADKDSLAYNNTLSLDDDGHLPTIEEVQKRGSDVTEDFLALPWEDS